MFFIKLSLIGVALVILFVIGLIIGGIIESVFDKK